MTAAEELVAAVRARTAGTPYVLTETARGFDVHIDLQDTAWHATLYEQHLSQAFTYHVTLDPERRTLSITDDARAVTWSAGPGSGGATPTPTLAAAASRSLGRLPDRRVQVTYSRNGRGGYDKSVDVDTRSSEGRDLVRQPARELGWTEKRGVAERFGLYVGVGALALVALTGVVAGIVALTHAF